jgi:hypothetical protein
MGLPAIITLPSGGIAKLVSVVSTSMVDGGRKTDKRGLVAVGTQKGPKGKTGPLVVVWPRLNLGMRPLLASLLRSLSSQPMLSNGPTRLACWLWNAVKPPPQDGRNGARSVTQRPHVRPCGLKRLKTTIFCRLQRIQDMLLETAAISATLPRRMATHRVP